MLDNQSEHQVSFSVPVEQPLIGVMTQEDGNDVVRYFFEDVPSSRQSSLDAQRLAGAWSDLDWDEIATVLERMRHDSPPSPPLSL
jgi:hypothetical protein